MTAETRESNVSSGIANAGLAEEGLRRIEWAAREMPVIAGIRQRFEREQPLSGVRIAACLHVTSETANLMLTLRDGGADVRLCASNPLSTQDEVAAALVVEHGIPTFAIKGESTDTYREHLSRAVEHGPQLTMDDGADLVALLHSERRDLLDGVAGGTEQTTAGLTRERALAKQGGLAYPIVAVNDARTKHFFDNRYGTGQSTIDGIIRATNILLAGKTFVVCGYGWCGRGLASRARGLGAHVIVTEVQPLPALEAVMDGFRVMPIADAALEGDIFVTVTGDINVIDEDAFAVMKSGAVMANSGHFDTEINLRALKAMSETRRELRPFVEEYTLNDGRKLVVLTEGRLVNLGAAEGHPASVMDMSFANQALSVEYLVNEHSNLEPGVYDVPRDIDDDVARLKLAAMGVHIDTLTEEQERYLSSWELDTE
jgi:adenosylhomocysteinase